MLLMNMNNDAALFQVFKSNTELSQKVSQKVGVKKVTYISNRKPLSFQLLDLPTGSEGFIQKVNSLWVPCRT